MRSTFSSAGGAGDEPARIRSAAMAGRSGDGGGPILASKLMRCPVGINAAVD
jgi:hypothetical protein